MHKVSLAHIVAGNDYISVVCVLSFKDSVASETSELQSKVQFRKYVLGGKHTDVRLFFFLVREEGSPVCEFGVRSLGVVVRKGLRRVAVSLERSIEDGIVCLCPLEIVVGHFRRT